MSDPKTFTPSVQQQDFFNWVLDGRGSLILEAVAGSGKTETLARAVKLMNGYVTCMMFNKSAADEFKDRLVRVGADRKGVLASTCHSVGYSAWRRFDDQCDVEERKVDIIIERMCLNPATSTEDIGMLVEGTQFIKRLVSLGKQMLAGVKWGVDNLEAWLRLVQHYGLDGDVAEDMDIARLVTLAQDVFIQSGKACKSNADRRGVLDFDDMIWAPLAYNVRFFTVDWVLGDEWQDANPARLELAFRCLKPHGRFIACGDSRQAIYGFTGADHESLNTTAKKFNAARLPLSVTYRCPKAVVSFVHQWVGHIEAHENAIEGEVRPVTLDPTPRKEGDAKQRPWYLSDKPTQQDFILCRYNKPLVTTAFGLIRDGIPCKMEGRDIGNGLIALAKRWKVRSLNAVEAKLEKYRAKEITKARAKKSEAQEQTVNDKVDCVLIFIERCRAKGADSIDCLVEEIKSLFDDNVKDVLTLASGHKSKGRERKRVYWIVTEHRGKRELPAHEQLQEDNIKYVIGTRAQETLVLVPEALVASPKRGA